MQIQSALAAQSLQKNQGFSLQGHGFYLKINQRFYETKTSTVRWVKKSSQRTTGAFKCQFNKELETTMEEKQEKIKKSTQIETVGTITRLELRHHFFTCSTFV